MWAKVLQARGDGFGHQFLLKIIWMRRPDSRTSFWSCICSLLAGAQAKRASWKGVCFTVMAGGRVAVTPEWIRIRSRTDEHSNQSFFRRKTGEVEKQSVRKGLDHLWMPFPCAWTKVAIQFFTSTYCNGEKRRGSSNWSNAGSFCTVKNWSLRRLVNTAAGGGAFHFQGTQAVLF